MKHIVHMGYDVSIFGPDAGASDTRSRFRQYLRAMDQREPGSCFSYLAIDPSSGKREALREGNFMAESVPADSGRLSADLTEVLERWHGKMPISLISPQSTGVDAEVALAFGERHNTPVLLQLHHDIFHPQARREHEGCGWRGWREGRRVRRRLARAAAIRVVGSRLARQLQARGYRMPIRTIPVPMPMLETATVPEEGERKREVLYVGRLAEQKRLDVWLEVAARVARVDPEVQFVWVGAGPLEGVLREKAARLGLGSRLHFHGAVTYDHLPRQYSQSAVFLLTSGYEGFGRVVAESLHCGTPVVAPRITGVEDIIEEGATGYLLEPDDVTGMAERVLELLHDIPLRRRMGQAGRESVRNRFATARLVREWVDFQMEVAG